MHERRAHRDAGQPTPQRGRPGRPAVGRARRAGRPRSAAVADGDHAPTVGTPYYCRPSASRRRLRLQERHLSSAATARAGDAALPLQEGLNLYMLGKHHGAPVRAARRGVGALYALVDSMLQVDPSSASPPPRSTTPSEAPQPTVARRRRGLVQLRIAVKTSAFVFSLCGIHNQTSGRATVSTVSTEACLAFPARLCRVDGGLISVARRPPPRNSPSTDTCLRGAPKLLLQRRRRR